MAMSSAAPRSGGTRNLVRGDALRGVVGVSVIFDVLFLVR
jgi:hypothetical protein